MFLQFKNSRLDLSRPRVMGILNVTPDSFSDGGRYDHIDNALRHAEQMCKEGASIIDVGGESTRPGAQAVSVDEELDRVIPVIERLSHSIEIPISIDTSKATVMREAVKAGAAMVNDVKALTGEGAMRAVAELAVPVCLMHMQGEPRVMQQAPHYQDVVAEVRLFLEERIRQCEGHGINRSRLLIDPGFGFGKTLQHNLCLLKNLSLFMQYGVPLLAGISRKSMLGSILGNDTSAPVEQRLYAGLAAAVIAALQGVSILRVHDVAATMDVLSVVNAVVETP